MGYPALESSWNVMAHVDAREGKWRRNLRMEWVASTLHTTSVPGVSSITTSDAHTSAASSRLNWRPRRFKWTRPFRGKTKYGFCACAITFKTRSNSLTTFRDSISVPASRAKNPRTIPLLLAFLTLEGRVIPKRREGITTIRHVRGQKSAVLIYLAAEIWNLAYRWVSSLQLMCLYHVTSLTHVRRLSCSPTIWRRLLVTEPVLVYGHQTRFSHWRGTWTTTWRIQGTW